MEVVKGNLIREFFPTTVFVEVGKERTAKACGPTQLSVLDRA